MKELRRRGIHAYSRGSWVFLLWCPQWSFTPRGISLVREFEGGVEALSSLLWSEADIMLKKSDQRVRVDGVASKLDDNDTKSLFPTLWDYMTQDRWDDGTPRETSSLLIFAQDGMLKAMLRDRENGQCLWTAGVSVATVMFQLDTALNDPNADWKADKAVPSTQAKNPRKK